MPNHVPRLARTLVLTLFSLGCGSSGSTGTAASTSPPVVSATAIRPSPSAVPSSPPPSPRPPQRSKTRYVVAAMGDSLTDPKSHGGKYLTYLDEKCPASRFDSYGVGGNMVNQMRRRFVRDIYGEVPGQPPQPRPDYTHVLFLGGINDICSDESAFRTNDKIQRDFTWMFAEAKRRGDRTIVLTLPPWAGFERFYNARRGRSTLEMNRWFVDQHKNENVDLLFDLYPLMSCGKPDHLCPDYGWPDQVHWNTKGHEVAGEALYAALFSDCR